MASNFIGTDAAGTVAVPNVAGVEIDGGATGNTIGGTVAIAANLISGNAGDGVAITGSGSDDNVVLGNYIGTDTTGTFAIGNGAAGVSILNDPGNTIGGTTGGSRNVISGNAVGVSISGSAGTFVAGNFIGTDLRGTAAVGNSIAGVVVSDSSATTIGFATALGRNVISGNLGDGVDVLNASVGTIVLGNYIGVDETGTQPLGNGGDGVRLFLSPETTIGGSAQGAGNVISANEDVGVSIQGSSSSGGAILGNLIGTDYTGAIALGNGTDGVDLDDMSDVTIGGTSEEDRNVISGNDGAGIELVGDDTDNLIEGNYIGTDITGAGPLGNGTGILIEGGSSDNTIGGTVAGPATRSPSAHPRQQSAGLATGIGVDVAASAGAGNAIRLNSIFSDAMLGIDLGGNGVTLNNSEPHSGPNDYENFPVITTVVTAGGTTTVSGDVE